MIETSSQARPTPSAGSGLGAPPRVEDRRRGWRNLLLGAFSTLTYLFLYAPIIILVLFSFTTDSFGVRFTGFTFSWYSRLLQDERLIGASINTLKVALIST